MSGEIGKVGFNKPLASRPSPPEEIKSDDSDVRKEADAGEIIKDVQVRTINDDTMEKIPPEVQKYFTRGNKITSLFDEKVTPDDSSDEIFAQIEKMIRGAEKSIQVEMFHFDKKNLVDLLIKEAKNGVDVKVIMDPPNEGWEKDRKEAIDKLRNNGVEVLLYPVREANTDQSKYGQLNHIKMLIVDGNQAIIGGMNWGEYSSKNRDYCVAVEGPAVDKMEWLFREDWLKSGGKSQDLPRIEDTPPHPQGDAPVNLITSGLEPRQQTIGKTVLRAINNAKKSIYAELFVLTDPKTIDALKKAHARGIDVKVILNPLKINGKPINERAANELRKAGVPVKWYVCDPKTREKMHAKMALFDDDQIIVGSANWSNSGFRVNREASVEILSKEINSEFAKVFNDDWNRKTSDEPIYLEEPDNNAGG